MAPIIAAKTSEFAGNHALSTNGFQLPAGPPSSGLKGNQSPLSAIHPFDWAFEKKPFSALNCRARPRTKNVGNARIGANHKERCSGFSASKIVFLIIQ